MFIVSADALRRILITRVWSLNELGRRSGVTTNVLSKLVQNDSRVTIPTLGKIAKALGVDYSELIKKEEPVK